MGSEHNNVWSEVKVNNIQIYPTINANKTFTTISTAIVYADTFCFLLFFVIVISEISTEMSTQIFLCGRENAALSCFYCRKTHVI